MLAQHSDAIRERRLKNLRPFKKGQSGNPGGRPKKLEITRMYQQILGKPANRKEIKESLLRILTSGRMAAVLLAREMAERTEGKVSEEVNLNANVSVTLEQVLEARKKAGK